MPTMVKEKKSTRVLKYVCASTVIFVSAIFSVLGFAESSGYARVTNNGVGAVASVNPIATQAGIDAFSAGGNAIDAALAVAFTLGVVDSHNSGIGGGCFIVMRTAGGEIFAIDGREMAPARAHRDMFFRNGKADPTLSKVGALAIGVPGSVAALDFAQRSAGKLSLSQVVLPAAKIAENGFLVDGAFAKRLSSNIEKIKQFPSSSEVFLRKNDVPLLRGERLVQKDLGKTYRQLAKHGPSYFYGGEFAQRVEDWMKANGGVVAKNDFENYALKLRRPIQTTFNGYEIYGFPPPSSGGVHVAQILNILSEFDLKSMSESDRYHVIIEAMKLAFADRAHWLGDPDYAKVPKGLIAQNYAESLAKKISLKSTSAVPTHNTPPDIDEAFFGKHTTHIATADAEGNWVAITTTLNTSFGSKVVIPRTGVLMNNQMDDFSAQPGAPNAFGLIGAEANAVAPGKRPLSSMSPTIVLKDGKPVMTVGAAGGPTIISQVTQALINVLLLEKDLDTALETVRVHHQWRPDRVYYDKFAPKSLVKDLEDRGHTMKVWPPFGATQAIVFDKKEGFTAVSEPRITGKR